MKTKIKIIVVLTFLATVGNTIAQNTFPSGGNVGIGTLSPQQRLHIHNGISPNFMLLSGVAPGILFAPNQTSSLILAAMGLATSSGHYFPTAQVGDFGIRGSGGGDLLFGTLTSNPNGTERMRIANNGNVGIGSTNPDEKLTVKGTIHAEEIKVDLNVPADYVFENYFDGTSSLKSDYSMPSLQEVEAYIKENYHLPEVPSAEEIKEEGLLLKEMTNLLLQKIEELTLYTIEQEHKIEALVTANKNLANQLEILSKKVK